MDRMNYRGTEYELVPKTMKIARMIEAAEMADTVTEAYKREFDFVRTVIGDPAVTEILGTTNLEEIDLNEMVYVYNCIIDGYEAELNEQRREQEIAAFSGPAFDKISELAKDVRTLTDVEKASKVRKK